MQMTTREHQILTISLEEDARQELVARYNRPYRTTDIEEAVFWAARGDVYPTTLVDAVINRLLEDCGYQPRR